MTKRETTDLQIRFVRRPRHMFIAALLGLTLIALPACSDDGPHDGDGHAPADHEQMDEHVGDHDAQPMDNQAENEHDAADDHEH